MSVGLSDILQLLDQRAPWSLAEDWDNVGLLIDPGVKSVDRVVVALDPSTSVVEQAIQQGAQALLTHHPLLFRPLTSIRRGRPVDDIAISLLRAGIAHIAAHTNLDNAPRGTADVVAQRLGLTDVHPFGAGAQKPWVKVIVFVPSNHVESVRTAMAAAGAGLIGDYECCSFAAPGVGSYRPLTGAQPYQGEVGRLERADELRLEMLAPRSAVERVLAAMCASHPYEEVAYDVIGLENAVTPGRAGMLQASQSVPTFVSAVHSALNLDRVVLAGRTEGQVERVAVVTGAGASFLPAAASLCDTFVTGDVKHHDARLAEELGVTVIDAGHFGSERPACDLLAEWLQTRFGEQLEVTIAAESPPLTPCQSLHQEEGR